MWRRNSDLAVLSPTAQSNSILGYPNPSPTRNTRRSTVASMRHSFFGSNARANEHGLVFSLEVPTPGPLGLDLRARHVERDIPQRGAVVKGFRPLSDGTPGYVESTGRVKVGDVLEVIHNKAIDSMQFEHIVQHAYRLQSDPSAWPLKLVFRREHQHEPEETNKSRRSSIFRSSSTTISSPGVPDRSFNEKLTFFRGFFANKFPSGVKSLEKEKAMPSHETVNEMYRQLLVKRDVPEDVMDELVRIEPLETKWHMVWYAQQHEDDTANASQLAEAEKLAENLVLLKWDNKGLKDIETLRMKISMGSTAWLEGFLAHFGLDYLTMKLPDPSPFPIEYSKFEKATLVCEQILKILKSITHFTAGVETITNVPGLVKRMALCFHTDNPDLKRHTLQLLGIVCYNSAAGHNAVIEAFDHYKEVKGETIRFSCLRDALKSTRYSLSFKEDVLSFVNIIVNKAIRLEDRLSIRGDFLALKMGGYFEEIRAKSQAVQRPKTSSVEEIETKSDPSLETLEENVNDGIVGDNIDTQHATITSPRRSQSLHSTKSKERLSIPGESSPRRKRTNRIISSSTTKLRTQLDNMEKQIEVFERFMEDDRKDTIYEQTDLSSCQSVVQTLLENVAKDSELQNCFLSILQQLLFIPGDRTIGKEMWGLCERLIKQVSLLSPVEEVRRFEIGYEDRKTVLRLRDKYTAFLNKESEQDTSFTFHLGPILLIENRKENEEFVEEGEDEQESEIAAKDHPDLSKYFKLVQMGMPMEHVQQKMKNEVSWIGIDILQTPERLVPIKEIPPMQALEHEKYAKYFKLKKMGMPLPHIQLKMQAEGLDSSILETPHAQVDVDGNLMSRNVVDVVRAGEHEKYVKYFKLMNMGMPVEHVKLKVSAEGLDSSVLESPDTLLDTEGKRIESHMTVAMQDNVFQGIPARDHELYVKYFKLLRMGMPLEQVQLKASAEGFDSSVLDRPDTLLNEDGTEFVASVKGIMARDHEKYAKFFKLKKMGMPMEHVQLKVSAEGLDPSILETPDQLLDEEGRTLVQISNVAVKNHPRYLKYFKLLEMGMPLANVQLKVNADGLQGELLERPDTLVNENGLEVVKVVEHPQYKKYFALMKMGMPRQQLELKMNLEGLDVALLDTPNELMTQDKLETSKPAQKSPVPVKPKLRHLYWETIHQDALIGTVWEQVDVLESHDTHIEKLSELFVNKPPKAKDTVKQNTSTKRRIPTRVSLIDVKRANNIGIMLARFRLPYAKIRQAILEVDKEVLSSEKLSAMIQFAPEAEEIEAVKRYTGSFKLLGDAEQYFRELISIPRFLTRLQAIYATWQLDIYAEEQTRLMLCVRNACTELKQCARLQKIFKIVLLLGNALNGGTPRGDAKGFRLSILLKLNQVKASDNSMSLLNFVAYVLRANDPLIFEFDKDMPSMESASRVTIQLLKAGETAVRKAANLICQELAAHAQLEKTANDVVDRFQDAIRPFAEHAQQKSEQLQKELDNVMHDFEQTMIYYGENPSESGPDAFFSIFYSFAKMLQTADRDNERKRISEERRMRREEETMKRLETLKKKKMETSYASLKDGDVDDIMMKIRAKRAAELRKELLETPYEVGRGRASSRGSSVQGSSRREERVSEMKMGEV